MTETEIKDMGIRVTQEIWNTYKDNFADPGLKKHAYDMLGYCLNAFKAHIPNMQTEEFWHRPADYLVTHEIIRRLMIEYANIDDKAWSEEFCKRFGGNMRTSPLEASASHPNA